MNPQPFTDEPARTLPVFGEYDVVVVADGAALGN